MENAVSVYQVGDPEGTGEACNRTCGSEGCDSYRFSRLLALILDGSPPPGGALSCASWDPASDREELNYA